MLFDGDSGTEYGRATAAACETYVRMRQPSTSSIMPGGAGRPQGTHLSGGAVGDDAELDSWGEAVSEWCRTETVHWDAARAMSFTNVASMSDAS